MKYSEWEEGLPPPEGYTIQVYYHCDGCRGHQYLEPDKEAPTVRPREAQLYRRVLPPGTTKSTKYFNDKRGGRL